MRSYLSVFPLYLSHTIIHVESHIFLLQHLLKETLQRMDAFTEKCTEGNQRNSLTCIVILPISGPSENWYGTSDLPTTATLAALSDRKAAASIPELIKRFIFEFENGSNVQKVNSISHIHPYQQCWGESPSMVEYVQ